jgi:hypothetical protein
MSGIVPDWSSRLVSASRALGGIPVIDVLLEREEQGWEALSSSDPVQFCREWLADDAVMIVPGRVIDRATFLEAVAREQPWATHRIEEPRVIRLSDDSAALVYRVTAQRDDQPKFVGLLTSIYVNRAGRWQLALHQQTPLPTTP